MAMTDKDIGVMTPDKQAAMALLKDRKVPMTTDNLSRALTIIARGNNSNDTRPSDIDQFNLDAPAAPIKRQGNAPTGQTKRPQVDPASIQPSEQPTDPLAGAKTGGGVGDLLPWLIPLLGIARQGVGGIQSANPTVNPGAGAGASVGGGIGGEQGVPRLPAPQGKLPGPQVTPSPMSGEMDLTGQGSAPPQLGAPRPMSMFSDKYSPEAGDELSRKLMLAAESGGLGSGHVDALKALSNIMGTGPNDAALDESRAAIAALQDLPYVRQQQMMGMMRGNPILSEDFNAYLQPKIKKPGDALKPALKRASRG